MTYAKAADGVEVWEVPDIPKLKAVSEYKFVGKPIARVDLKDKVFGAPIFGMDATLPDMLYGAVVRPSSIGAKIYRCEYHNGRKKCPGWSKLLRRRILLA